MGRRTRATVSRSVGCSQAVDMSCCVAEVMGTDLFTLTPDTVVASALRLATSKRIHHFLVVQDGSLTGIVCDDDLRQARQSTTVGACMHSPVLCIGPETTLADAASIMDDNSIGCLPVITGAFLVGMITRDRLPSPTEAAIADEATAEIEREEYEEREGQAVAPAPSSACAVCGGHKHVRPNLRANLAPLCSDCSGITAAPPRRRGN